MKQFEPYRLTKTKLGMGIGTHGHQTTPPYFECLLFHRTIDQDEQDKSCFEHVPEFQGSPRRGRMQGKSESQEPLLSRKVFGSHEV